MAKHGRKHRRKLALPNIPLELIVEILSRIPVKSLLRFRWVSRLSTPLQELDVPGGRTHLTTGFGYDSHSEDYVIVLIKQSVSPHFKIFYSEVDLYRLKSDSWTRKYGFPHEIRLNDGEWGVLVNKCLHWAAGLEKVATNNQILVYEIQSGRFDVFPIEFIDSDDLPFWVIHELDDRLSLSHRTRDMGFDFWVLKVHGVKESWIKLFRVDNFNVLSPLVPITCSMDGNTIVIQHLSDPKCILSYDIAKKSVIKFDVPRLLSKEVFALSVSLVNPIDRNLLRNFMKVEKVQDSTYDMIGGLDRQIEEIKEFIMLPLKHPELFDNLRKPQPKGVLLYGPSATGKTLLARAVAHHTDCTFITVDGSKLVQNYIDEGSRMVREIFMVARDHAPSIILIDEIESIGSARMETRSGNGGSEVLRTMLELLNQLNGIEASMKIKVLMATNNRIDILNQNLLRPEMIGKKIEIPYPNVDARIDILKIHSRNMNSCEIDWRRIAEKMKGASGAELKNVCTEAGKISLKKEKHHVTQEHFEMAADKITKISSDVRELLNERGKRKAASRTGCS